MHMLLIDFHAIIFSWFPAVFFRTALPHDVVGVNCNKGTTTDKKARFPSIWAKGLMLDIIFAHSDLT